MDKGGGELIYAVNFSPNDQLNYSFGVDGSVYEEVLNTDSVEFGGRGIINGILHAEKTNYNNREYKLTMKIPALSGVFLKRKNKRIRLG